MRMHSGVDMKVGVERKQTVDTLMRDFGGSRADYYRANLS
jgi:hypothetical protein